ncbi:MAG TPA: phosphatase PAP2 family protein [Gemmatimonadales bacterium]|nr:phosphatase PAP2 family protein [Gemmatimonadales bacterium]
MLAARWFAANRSRLLAGISRGWQRFIATRAMQRLKARYPGVWTFIARRFARGEYLGLHLTIGLAISLIGLWIFAAITEDVIHHDPITVFDLSLLNWLQAHATPTGHAIAVDVSRLGTGITLSALGLLVALLLAIRRAWLLLEGWLTAYLGAGVLNQALKTAIHRPRPVHSAILSSESWSFPSGHAMGSLIGYGMLAYLVIAYLPTGKNHRTAIVIAATVLVLAIGFSRLYLGVHYFSDVIGGFGAGVLWLSACISGLEVARRASLP